MPKPPQELVEDGSDESEQSQDGWQTAGEDDDDAVPQRKIDIDDTVSERVHFLAWRLLF